jgi:speckle-type POZ protein
MMKISYDLEKLFMSQKHVDVSLNVKGRNILVHKNILCARSSVFEAMFDHELSESQKNQVNIEDVSYDTLYALVKFIYSEKVEKLEDLAADLMMAADKYHIDDLKKKCVEYLREHLSIENAITCLINAHLIYEGNLRNEAILFVGK